MNEKDISIEELECTFDRVFELANNMNTLYEKSFKLAEDRLYFGRQVLISKQSIELHWYDHRVTLIKFILMHDMKNNDYIKSLIQQPELRYFMLESMEIYENVFLDAKNYIERIYDTLSKLNMIK